MHIMTDKLAKEIGERLKQLRLSRRMTQQDVSSQLNIGRSAYAAIELGNNLLTCEHLPVLCRIFHVSSDFILGISSTIDELREIADLYEMMPVEARYHTKIFMRALATHYDGAEFDPEYERLLKFLNKLSISERREYLDDLYDVLLGSGKNDSD